MLHYNITFIKDTQHSNLLTMITFSPIKTLCHLCGLLLLTSANLHAQDTLTKDNRAAHDQAPQLQGPIVVSIKPLYSLVAHLTQGIEKPVLLMQQSQSPHHYSIRPSERRLLANAKMIVWLGPQMESMLAKIIAQSSSVVVSAMQAENLILLKNRTKHSSHLDHASETSESLPHTTQHHETASMKTDPHIWLSTHNAAAISEHISKQLIAHDASNAAKYQANLQQLLDKIKQTEAFIKATLKDDRQPFIAYHDAFQYFENENALNYVAAINSDDETSISLKYMREITARIENEKITCLVYQPPKPAIIDALAQQHRTMNVAMLDTLGITLDNNETAWFELMRRLAENFKQCLTKK